ncbi:carbon-phosphorus lyase complex subunit PhnI [Peptococcaceae bacterium]|nr:carbon-phosphorus lyase complex subunit PhnI [Peptococcaceae bacterium]
MAYVAVKGGQKAINAAEQLVNYYRCKGGSTPLQVQQILDQMRLAVDRVMSEGALYAPELAALALKQSEGDSLEAAFLLRAFRSTLARNYYSLPANTTAMRVIRRISAAFKDIPGGQYLGPTRDYIKRLLDFKLVTENEQNMQDFIHKYLPAVEAEMPTELPTFPKVIDLLREQGLLVEPEFKPGDQNIDDITRQSLRFPASRAMCLQTLTRGETGAKMALAYSSMRGYGAVHPCLAELKVGYVELVIAHPLQTEAELTLGEVLITEVELVARLSEQASAGSAQFTLGYGICFGHNEVKAIAMATLDRAMKPENPLAPAEDQEFVLYHIDGIEAAGFVSHWKLPHYVDFQADLNRLRSVQQSKAPAAKEQDNGIV